MKLFLTSLLAVSVAQGIFAADADAGAGADVPATGLRRGTANKHVDRRTNEYWAAPIADSGLACVDNSIRAGGDKPAEICLTEGEALCISYDDRPMGGRWQFGIKESHLRLYDPKGDVVWEYCRDVTHLCIGEDHGFDPNQYSQERPYMTLYDEKSHEVVGSLTCDGIDGKDDKNIGRSTILKLVDHADVGPYTDYPLPIVKLRKGQTEDPADENSLWDIMYNPNNPRGLADFDAYSSYNQGKCVWTDLCPISSVPTADTCDPSKVVLADYPQWKAETGYWVGELSYYDSDGLPNNSSRWPYNYQTYRGFITGNTACNKYRQRNLFLYKAWNETLVGSSKIFFADQNATTTCDGNIEGPFPQNGITLQTKTTLVGQDNAVLYQVTWPKLNGPTPSLPFNFSCEESIFQSQLTTLNTLPDGNQTRTRTAQGFVADCDFHGTNRGKQDYASFYRETRVSKDEFYAQLNATVEEYNIPDSNLGAYLGDNNPSGNSGYAFVVEHLESSFELECDYM